MPATFLRLMEITLRTWTGKTQMCGLLRRYYGHGKTFKEHLANFKEVLEHLEKQDPKSVI